MIPGDLTDRIRARKAAQVEAETGGKALDGKPPMSGRGKKKPTKAEDAPGSAKGEAVDANSGSTGSPGVDSAGEGGQ